MRLACCTRYMTALRTHIPYSRFTRSVLVPMCGCCASYRAVATLLSNRYSHITAQVLPVSGEPRRPCSCLLYYMRCVNLSTLFSKFFSEVFRAMVVSCTPELVCCCPALITILHEVGRCVNPFVQIYLKKFLSWSSFLLYARARVRRCEHVYVCMAAMRSDLVASLRWYSMSITWA